VPEQLTGPDAGAAGEFEHAPGRPEGLERPGQLVTPRQIQALLQIAPPEGVVVGRLLIEQPLELFFASGRRHNPSPFLRLPPPSHDKGHSALVMASVSQRVYRSCGQPWDSTSRS